MPALASPSAQLERLDLGANGLPADAVRALVETALACPRMSELIVFGNTVDEGVQRLVEDANREGRAHCDIAFSQRGAAQQQQQQPAEGAGDSSSGAGAGSGSGSGSGSAPVGGPVGTSLAQRTAQMPAGGDLD